MTIPVYVLSDLEAIEAESALHLSAIFETPVTITGNRADHPRTGTSGSDVGGAREITATIGDEHVAHTYYNDLCAAYEWERRGSYGVYLANEITRRWGLQHTGAPPALDETDDEDETTLETETIL